MARARRSSPPESANAIRTLGRTLDRVEWTLLSAVIVIGLIIRLPFADRIAIEHFDEGVYASNIWFEAEAGFRYPLRHLYAPPLLPGLIEFAMTLLPRRGVFECWPNLLAGISMPLLLWWFIRRWFGSPTGVIASMSCVFSDLHAAYSRTALTDALLCVWLFLAVALYIESIRRHQVRLAVIAGLFTGLAWWTKYNGWLPLVITASGSVAALPFERDRSARQLVRRVVIAWGVMAVTALICWSPVLYGLQETGGYATVAANHRQYVVGLGGWLGSALRQGENLWHFDRVLGIGMIIGVIGVNAILSTTSATPANDRSAQSSVSWRMWIFVTVASGLIVAAGATLLLATTGLIGLLGGFWRELRTRLAPATPPETTEVQAATDECNSKPFHRLAWWIFAAWFFGLLFATPMYRPYSRLVLPWLVSVWVTGAVGICQFWEWSDSKRWWTSLTKSAAGNFPYMAVWKVVVVPVIVALIWFGRSGINAVPAWQDRSGMENAAKKIAEAITTRIDAADRNRPIAIFVYGEPSLFFQLRSAGFPLAEPTVDLAESFRLAKQMNVKAFCVIGPHARRSTSFSEEWERVAPTVTLVRTVEYTASDIVLLDQVTPRELRTHFEPPLEVFQVR